MSLALTGCGDSSSETSSGAPVSGTTVATPVPAAGTTSGSASSAPTAPTKTTTTPVNPAPPTTAPVSSTSGGGGSSGAPASTPPANTKSVGAYVACTGSSDDTAGFAKALKAASNNAFTLVVDCPVTLKIGKEYQRSLFIDNGTSVQFTSNGKVTIDNLMVPAFVVANSSKITLTDWNVEYDGAGLPMDPDVGGYMSNGVFTAAGGHVQPAGAFNNFGITGWLAANRGVKFNNVTSIWAGGIVPMAVFYISGDTSDVTITGLKLYVPPTTGVEKFIPVAFSLTANFKSNQSVTSGTPRTSKYVAVPHDLTFSNIDLDGTYMGWLGNSQDVLFENITSRRYGDLQDAQGNNVGGLRKWFAPPHLFYLNYDFAGDQSLANTNLQLKNITDLGIRLGTARDKGGSDSTSGYANSLKIGCNDCYVDTYKSARPDGVLDVLRSNNLTISNVQASYDSNFIHSIFPGWRFPGGPYSNLTFENITLSDTAASVTRAPIGPANADSNVDMVFTNVSVNLKKWDGYGLPLPTISGTGNQVSLQYSFASNNSRLSNYQADPAQVTIQATPATLSVGQSMSLNWQARDANNCAATNAWSGSVGVNGNRTVKMTTAGNFDYTVTCRSANTTSIATVRVVVQ